MRARTHFHHQNLVIKIPQRLFKTRDDDNNASAVCIINNKKNCAQLIYQICKRVLLISSCLPKKNLCKRNKWCLIKLNACSRYTIISIYVFNILDSRKSTKISRRWKRCKRIEISGFVYNFLYVDGFLYVVSILRTADVSSDRCSTMDYEMNVKFLTTRFHRATAKITDAS